MQTLASVPLLKFNHDQPTLCEEGLAVIEALPGPLCPVAFVGDGRSGKSYLASKVVGERGFRRSCDRRNRCGNFKPPRAFTGLRLRGREQCNVQEPFDCHGGWSTLCHCADFCYGWKSFRSCNRSPRKERSLIKCDGTGSLQAQTLLFVVNQSRLRYGEDALEKILSADHGEERKEVRSLISKAYPEHQRDFFTVPVDNKSEFQERWEKLHEAIRAAAVPLKMGKLWMTGPQVVQMLRKVEQELRTRGKVSLPSLHRHVILDGWLKPTVGQVLQSRMDKLWENVSQEEFSAQKVGSVEGHCSECKNSKKGWLDPDVEEFFCEDCWRKFSPKVLKCCFCGNFFPWVIGCGTVLTA